MFVRCRCNAELCVLVYKVHCRAVHVGTPYLQRRAAGLHAPHVCAHLQRGARLQGPACSPGPSPGLCSSAGSRQAPGFPPGSASPGNPGGPGREGPGASPALPRAGAGPRVLAAAAGRAPLRAAVPCGGRGAPFPGAPHHSPRGWGASPRPSPPRPWLCAPMSSALAAAAPRHPGDRGRAMHAAPSVLSLRPTGTLCALPHLVQHPQHNPADPFSPQMAPGVPSPTRGCCSCVCAQGRGAGAAGFRGGAGVPGCPR